MAYRSITLAALSDATCRLPVFDGGATTVTIEHRNLERFGESTDMIAGKLRGGWLRMLGRYVQHVAKYH